MQRYTITLMYITLTAHFFMRREAVANENKKQPLLQLFPEFCITSSKQLSYDLTVTLKYFLSHFKPTCILSPYHKLMTWCNDLLLTKLLTLDVDVKKDISFIMIDKEANKKLAEGQLKVTSALTPSLRRTFRNVWSLF